MHVKVKQMAKWPNDNIIIFRNNAKINFYFFKLLTKNLKQNNKGQTKIRRLMNLLYQICPVARVKKKLNNII